MRFSLIAPNLNEAENIPYFLNGIYSQTFRDFEVVIIDGGSYKDYSLLMLARAMNHFRNMKILINTVRCLGYIRNYGSQYAVGEIMLHMNSDNVLESDFLERLNKIFEDPNVISVAGRVYPIGRKVISNLAYGFFDFMRWFFTILPPPLRKYRPSGNFTAVRSKHFWAVDGFPNWEVNEDGELGARLDDWAFRNKKKVVFRLDMKVGHFVKKFEVMGGLKAFLFYLYILANYFPFLQSVLRPTLEYARAVFSKEKPKRVGLRELLKRLWEWL